ncbi:MAG: hypothetical protein EA426_12955 [Spirochaetaceae bacterium]|nr:MAG: hypothetical protein EA426_12955 [Spirochaetaceae bacterium]
MKKFECPDKGCDAKNINGVHRLFTHWYGAHYCTMPRDDQVKTRREIKEKAITDNTNVFAFIWEKLQDSDDGIDDEDTHDIFIAQPDKGRAGEVSGDERPFVINRFLDPEEPVCREERHYAHLLASRLHEHDGNDALKLALGLNGTVVEVMYEATLMRDFWADRSKKGRDEFTRLLKDYVKAYLNQHEAILTESDGFDWDAEPSVPGRFPTTGNAHPLVRWMMRAKPDIGVLWVPTEHTHGPTLTFFECKYKSGLSTYREDGFSMRQDCVQSCILEFLCNNLGLRYNDGTRDDLAVRAGAVVPVQFFVGEAEKKRKNEVAISIADLTHALMRA